jgi:predicted negative regulator of RcsB-dependent stress response
VADLRTEEEQIEALKNWWQENGKSLIVTVGIVIAGWVGFDGYQNSVAASNESASSVYQNLITTVSKPELSDEDKSTVTHLVAELKNDYTSSTYALYGTLFNAKLAMNNQEIDKAATELQWVLDHADGQLALTARLRLARINIAQDKADEALALLNIESGTLASAFAEVKGDAFYAKGDMDQARSAYAKAVELTDGAASPVLKMKLDDLAVVEAQADVSAETKVEGDN